MRIAVIDLGTNTFHLLIADVLSNRSYKKIFTTRATVKLGKGGINDNIIADVPFRKGVATISHFNTPMKKYKAEKVFAFGTSAIRSARNGKEFIERVKDKTKIDVKIITGEEEATMIYYGVRQCVNLGAKPALIIDIGGGSTELIIANNKKLFWKYSFNIGASRLLEKFHLSDPINKREADELESYFDKVLKPVSEAVKKYPVTTLVGSSGSFDTLAEIIGYKFHGRNVIKGVNTYKFNMAEYKIVHKQLLLSTTAQRKKMKGLIRMRVDMIVVASICTSYVLKRLKLKEMVLSKYALKEGAMWDVINKTK